MADTKISALVDGAAPQAGDEAVVVRAATNRRVQLGTAAGSAITAFATAAQGSTADTAVQPSSTNTLTNKWVKRRVTSVTNTVTSVTIDYSVTNTHITTAQAGALLYNNPTGAPGEADSLLISIRDNGTARALTWDTQFRAATASALPTTTTVNKVSYFTFIWNATDSKWDYTGASGPF